MWKNGQFKPSIGSHAAVNVALGKLNFTRVFNGATTCVLMMWHRVLCISLYVSFCAPRIILCFLCLYFLCFCLPPSTFAFLCLCFLCLCFLCFCFPPNLVERSSCFPDTATQAPQAQEYGSTTKRYFLNTQQKGVRSFGFVVHEP